MDALYLNDPDAIVTAAWHGEYEVLLYLLNKGSSIDTQDNTGNTALIAAIDQGYLGIAKFLIEKGANINMQDNEGDTALDIALFHDYQEIAELLIANGAVIKERLSEKEKLWDSIYLAFDHADSVKRLLSDSKKTSD